jgi:hypothetical protein
VAELAKVKAEREERQAKEAETPATVVELKKTQQQISGLKTWLHAVTGRKPL